MEKWVTFHYFLRVKFFGKFVVILGVFKLNCWKYSVFICQKDEKLTGHQISSFLKTWQQTSNNKFNKTNFLFKIFILKTANIAKIFLWKSKQMLSHNSYKQTKHPNNTQNSGLNVFSFIYLLMSNNVQHHFNNFFYLVTGCTRKKYQLECRFVVYNT